jgi:hypothetical protein
MATGGNDPFLGSNTRNLLQHVLSPKIVSDGNNGYATKLDMINIDNIYASGTIYGTAGSVVGRTTKTVNANGTTNVSVSDTSVTANSVVILTLKTAGGSAIIGPAYVFSLTPGTGFSIKSQVGDTSTYNYLIIN